MTPATVAGLPSLRDEFGAEPASMVLLDDNDPRLTSPRDVDEELYARWRALLMPTPTDDGRTLALPDWALIHLARLGPLVVARDLPEETGGGVCSWPCGRPLIYVDPRMAPAEQLETLAHELGHVDHGPRPLLTLREREDHADRWAAGWLGERGLPYNVPVRTWDAEHPSRAQNTEVDT